MAPLSTLTSLRRLQLCDNNPPACLPALTWLEQLAVTNRVRSMDGKLDAALPNLQNLKCLCLTCRIDYERILPALASLPRLQRLFLYGHPAEGADLRLPPGPWLASIRWLGLPWHALRPAPAAGMLSCAPHLEYLRAFLPPYALSYDSAVPEGHPLWTLAATHPPLRCLGIESYESDSAQHAGPFTPEATSALRLRRPQLSLRIMRPGRDIEAEALYSDAISDWVSLSRWLPNL